VPAPDSTLVTKSDGCAGGAVAVAFISDAMSASNCFNQFVIARTYRATDVCGNQAECVQTITVQDQTPPNLACPNSITLSCGSDLAAPDTSLVTASDGCGGGIVNVTFVSDRMSASNCVDQFVITRTYRATDACGNQAECSADDYYFTTLPPPEHHLPSAADRELPPPMCLRPDTSSVLSGDGCGGGATVTFRGDTMSASNCFNQFTITRS